MLSWHRAVAGSRGRSGESVVPRATTVRDVPEKLTVADPPPGMVPLEGSLRLR